MIIYQIGDYIKIIHPDYPELKGLAKVTNCRTTTVVVIEFCDDGSSFFANVDYLRLATKEEIEKHFAS